MPANLFIMIRISWSITKTPEYIKCFFDFTKGEFWRYSKYTNHAKHMRDVKKKYTSLVARSQNLLKGRVPFSISIHKVSDAKKTISV